jgi:hypothetical protein
MTTPKPAPTSAPTEQDNNWRTVKRPDQSVVHIIPMKDFEPHDEDAGCRCEPELLYVDDAFCDLLIHQAFDPDHPK